MQLDSLRTIAAFMVIFHHFLPELQIGVYNFGKYGVEIFFTISGFLITAILLKQREFSSPTFLKIKYFLVKRALRLFPVYYLFLIFFTVLAAFGLDIWSDGYGIYFYTYTINLLYYKLGMHGGQVNHLWTLAVEEQFYLIWPFVILLSRYKALKYIIVSLIIFSFVFKSLGLPDARLLTISHFDSLGLGAILAYILNTENTTSEKLKLFFGSVSPTFLLIIISVSIYISQILQFSIAQTILINALSVVLIIGCIMRFKGVIGTIMNSTIMIYLGRISYGLYIFHKPIPYFLNLISYKLNLPEINKYLMLTICIALTIFISHLSFKYFESHFIKVKAKFDL